MQYVIDSCVLFDLYYGEILDEFMELNVELYIPDVMTRELITPTWDYFSDFGISVACFSASDIREIDALRKHHLGPKVIDLFAFILAKNRKIGLLTCDKELRELCEDYNLPVHGSLWVIDQLVEKKGISLKKARRALQSMIESGSRFPQHEVDFRLRMWSDPK